MKGSPARPKPTTPVAHPVRIGELLLDPKNPRLAGLFDEPPTQDELLEYLWKEMAVDEVAISIALNGFQEYEPLFATREDGRLRVIEGNRRLAAVMLLRDAALRRRLHAEDLPEATTPLETLPVVECKREDVWQYVGFKHVNGPQVWQSHAKAQYIATVHETLRVPLDEIAQKIGDRNATVRRLYRGLVVLRQAEEAGEFAVDDRYKNHFAFSHLYTGLDYPGFQSFLGISDDLDLPRRPVPKSKVKALGELCRWLYGSKKQNLKPLIESQNPDLSNLAEALESQDGITALRRGLPIAAAREASIGDAELFRQALQQAHEGLRRARGFSLHGFRGEKSHLQTAQEIADLADALLVDMKRPDAGTRRARHASRA